MRDRVLECYQEYPLFLFFELSSYCHISGGFQDKVIQFGSDVSEGDLCLYTLLALPLEKPRNSSNDHKTKFLLLRSQNSLRVHGMSSNIVFMGEEVKE